MRLITKDQFGGSWAAKDHFGCIRCSSVFFKKSKNLGSICYIFPLHIFNETRNRYAIDDESFSKHRLALKTPTIFKKSVISNLAFHRHILNLHVHQKNVQALIC